jgi:hypothetical protein
VAPNAAIACWNLHIALCISTSIEGHMPTNLAIDDRLLDEAQKVGGHRTKKERP